MAATQQPQLLAGDCTTKHNLVDHVNHNGTICRCRPGTLTS
jgi:hypothetical protein